VSNVSGRRKILATDDLVNEMFQVKTRTTTAVRAAAGLLALDPALAALMRVTAPEHTPAEYQVPEATYGPSSGLWMRTL